MLCSYVLEWKERLEKVHERVLSNISQNTKVFLASNFYSLRLRWVRDQVLCYSLELETLERWRLHFHYSAGIYTSLGIISTQNHKKKKGFMHPSAVWGGKHCNRWPRDVGFLSLEKFRTQPHRTIGLIPQQLGLIPKLDLDWPWVGLDEIWIALLTPRRQPYPFKCHCYGHMGLTLLIQQLFVLYRGLNKTKQQGFGHAALDSLYNRWIRPIREKIKRRLLIYLPLGTQW